MWFENICTIYCQVKKARWILFVKHLGKKGTNIYLHFLYMLKKFHEGNSYYWWDKNSFKKRIRLHERVSLTYIYFVFFGFWAMRVYNLIKKTELKF